uniref:NADH-ubiquinone oxidoreductase chain 2 n=1 Tax=Chiridota sp. SS-2021 TaxID=2834204 RepID=A0A8E5JZJ8_9ECHN|nr:NADH dehydrogenase subunit 2 [Chiridota sp. SS-2021]
MSRIISFLLLISIFISTIVVISFCHWLIVWVAIEVGTFSVIPILFLSNTVRSVEASLKYFLVNVISAIILLMGSINILCTSGDWGMGLNSFSISGTSVIVIALLIKLGVAPFHLWFPEVIQGVGFLQGFLLSTWQKISPLYIMFVVNAEIKSEMLLIVGVSSVLISGWGGLNQTQTRKILSFSSIGFMGWLIVSLYYSPSLCLILFMLYIPVSGVLFFLFYYLNLLSLAGIYKVGYFSWFVFFVICGTISLGGLPPFGGFLIKFLPIYIISVNGGYLTLGLLILGTLLSLFYYLRLTFNLGLLLFPVSVGFLVNYRSSNSIPLSLSILSGWFLSISLFSLLLLGVFWVFV